MHSHYEELRMRLRCGQWLFRKKVVVHFFLHFLILKKFLPENKFNLCGKMISCQWCHKCTAIAYNLAMFFMLYIFKYAWTRTLNPLNEAIIDFHFTISWEAVEWRIWLAVSQNNLLKNTRLESKQQWFRKYKIKEME